VAAEATATAVAAAAEEERHVVGNSDSFIIVRQFAAYGRCSGTVVWMVGE